MMAYKWVKIDDPTTFAFDRREAAAQPGFEPEYDEYTSGPTWELRAVFWEEE